MHARRIGLVFHPLCLRESALTVREPRGSPEGRAVSTKPPLTSRNFHELLSQIG